MSDFLPVFVLLPEVAGRPAPRKRIASVLPVFFVRGQDKSPNLSASCHVAASAAHSSWHTEDHDQCAAPTAPNRRLLPAERPEQPGQPPDLPAQAICPTASARASMMDSGPGPSKRAGQHACLRRT